MDNKLEIVITMGGRGERFRRRGYNVPKFMIKAKGKTLFEWSMLSLIGFMENAKKFIFIALKDPDNDVEKFIRQNCKKLNIENYNVILLEELTDGQATTAMYAQNFWKEENPLLVYNIDTYVEPYEMNFSQMKGDGFIPCFKAPGNHWSFVRLDDNGNVVEIKEKERISDNCTIGAYYFKTCKLYKELYNTLYGTNISDKEKYIAPLYDILISEGGEVFISDINPQKVHVLGTPEELDYFINN